MSGIRQLTNLISLDEEKRILSHFYTLLEQTIREKDLMRYNNQYNSLYDVYRIVLRETYQIMIPEHLSKVEDLYEYNVLQHNHTQDRLTLAYVQEHFDRLVG